MMYSTIDIPQTFTAIAACIGALAGLVAAIGAILIARWQWKAANKAEAVNKVAETQRQANNNELKAIHSKVDGGHLGNGSLLAVLKSNALNARRIAMGSGSSEDLQAAIDAQLLLEAHMAAQEQEKAAKAKQAQETPEI